MGVKSYEASGYTNFVYSEDNDRTEVDLSYHDSWDWLMPVVNKCFDTWYYEYDSDDLCFLLNNALLTTNINEVYRVVTEFINEHNKNK